MRPLSAIVFTACCLWHTCISCSCSLWQLFKGSVCMCVYVGGDLFGIELLDWKATHLLKSETPAIPHTSSPQVRDHLHRWCGRSQCCVLCQEGSFSQVPPLCLAASLREGRRRELFLAFLYSFVYQLYYQVGMFGEIGTKKSNYVKSSDFQISTHWKGRFAYFLADGGSRSSWLLSDFFH